MSGNQGGHWPKITLAKLSREEGTAYTFDGLSGVRSKPGIFMKKVLLASAIALATVSAAIVPTQAETVVVDTHRHHHVHVDHHCKTTWVTHWRNHHKVTEKVRVCR